MKHSAAWLGCLLSLVALLLAGCASAGKCSRGAAGCACTSDSGCDTGGRCIDGMCVKQGDGGTAGKDSGMDAAVSTGDGSTLNDAGNNQDAGAPIDCAATTFDAACREYCRALCASEANLCLNSVCDTGFCGTNGGQLRSSCDRVCGTDVSCLQDLCTSEQARKCEEFGYPDDKGVVFVSGCFNEDPLCVLNPDYGCSDTCGTSAGGVGADLANNGSCEDGGDSSKDALCPRGTDCTDCGKRTCAQQGEKCMNGGDCCGFYPDMGAYCVDLDGQLTTQDAICLQNCDSTSCPNNTTCTKLDKDAGSVCAP